LTKIWHALLALGGKGTCRELGTIPCRVRGCRIRILQLLTRWRRSVFCWQPSTSLLPPRRRLCFHRRRFVCLFVSRITHNCDWFSQNLVERWHTSHGRNRYILEVIRITSMMGLS